MGKPLIQTRKKNKPTYLSILGVEKSKRIVDKLTVQAISSLEGVKGKTTMLVEVAEYLGKREH